MVVKMDTNIVLLEQHFFKLVQEATACYKRLIAGTTPAQRQRILELALQQDAEYRRYRRTR